MENHHTNSYKRARRAMLHAVMIGVKYKMSIRLTRKLVTKYCTRLIITS